MIPCLSPLAARRTAPSRLHASSPRRWHPVSAVYVVIIVCLLVQCVLLLQCVLSVQHVLLLVVDFTHRLFIVGILSVQCVLLL